MADNIMGPEVNLGLNVNLDLDQSAQDASTLADQIKQMRIDQEAFRDVIADTQDRLREMTSEFQEQLSLRQQLLDAEQSLRNLSDSRTQSLQDQVSAYREMEQSMSRLSQTSGGGMPYMGGMGGMGGMGRMSGFYGGGGMGMGGFYNPMSGTMMGMGGFPSAFSSSPAEEAMQAEEIYKEEENRGFMDRARQHAQDLFYFAGVPHELSNTYQSIGIGLNRAALISPSLRGASLAWNRFGKSFGGASKAAGAGAKISGFASDATALDDATAASEAGVGLTAAGSAALALRFAGPIGLAATSAMLGYKVVGDVLRTGQEYGALTGSDSPIGGYQADIQARLGSLLNPLMPYGVSQQIESTGLASGYKLNSNYLNGYRDFASGAFERYQMSPGESQAMFQNAVVRAGASSEQLSKALQSVAQNAANTGTSFKMATENLNGSIQYLSSTGMSGQALIGASTALSTQFTGGSNKMTQILQGVPDQFNNFFGGTMGQALLASQMNTTWSGLYAAEANLKGGTHGAAFAAQEDATIMHLMTSMGMHKGIDIGKINDQAMNMSMEFQQLGMNIDPKTAANLADYYFNHSGALEKKINKPPTAPNIHDYQAPGHGKFRVGTGNEKPRWKAATLTEHATSSNSIIELGLSMIGLGETPGISSGGKDAYDAAMKKYKAAEKKYNDQSKNPSGSTSIIENALMGQSTNTVQVEFTGKAKEWFQTHGPKNSGN